MARNHDIYYIRTAELPLRFTHCAPLLGWRYLYYLLIKQNILTYIFYKYIHIFFFFCYFVAYLTLFISQRELKFLVLYALANRNILIHFTNTFIFSLFCYLVAMLLKELESPGKVPGQEGTRPR